MCQPLLLQKSMSYSLVAMLNCSCLNHLSLSYCLPCAWSAIGDAWLWTFNITLYYLHAMAFHMGCCHLYICHACMYTCPTDWLQLPLCGNPSRQAIHNTVECCHLPFCKSNYLVSCNWPFRYFAQHKEPTCLSLYLISPHFSMYVV